MVIGLLLFLEDGAVRVTFYPSLTILQYGQLQTAIAGAVKKAELQAAIQSTVVTWGVEFSLADVTIQPPNAPGVAQKIEADRQSR